MYIPFWLLFIIAMLAIHCLEPRKSIDDNKEDNLDEMENWK